jgi:putative spermidine/putrescine transport system permease protein
VTTPSIYALGTLTTVVSFVVMGLTMLAIVRLRRRQSAGRVD